MEVQGYFKWPCYKLQTHLKPRNLEVPLQYRPGLLTHTCGRLPRTYMPCYTIYMVTIYHAVISPQWPATMRLWRAWPGPRLTPSPPCLRTTLPLGQVPRNSIGCCPKIRCGPPSWPSYSTPFKSLEKDQATAYGTAQSFYHSCTMLS